LLKTLQVDRDYGPCYNTYLNNKEQTMDEVLIQRVLKQIEKDVEDQDFTALVEMLEYVPERILKGFLPELDSLA